MPTDRFYRLPEEKKQIIKEAAIKEFARVPFEKASINQIIIHADISRGSFYTYFTDKQDVVFFIFEDIHEQMKQQCYRSLEANNGDYFRMLHDLFECFVEELQDTKNMIDMARNVCSYQENASAMGFGAPPDPWNMDTEDTTLTWMFDHVDRSGWRLDGSDDWKTLMIMGMAALMIALNQFYKYPERMDRIRIQYDKKLEILRYGVYSRTV